MSRPTPWTTLLLLTLLSPLPVLAGPTSPVSSPQNAVAASRGLTVTATATSPVLIGEGSSLAEPSIAPGVLFLSADISSTLVSSSTTSASLVVSAVCNGTEIEPLEVQPIVMNVPLPKSGTTATSMKLAVQLPWDGGRAELVDADYYTARSYSCTATVQLTATTSRRTKATTATANPVKWDVQITEQAASIRTTQPTNGDEVNTATFQATSLDGTSPAVSVAIGISPETLVTIDGQTLPAGSPVNISFAQPVGADIPSGSATPLFAAPVVDLESEGATFSPSVTLGFTLSGPLADTQNAIPLTYSETEQEWIDCRAEGSCTPVECPLATGFDEGMVCIEIDHFSLWTLGSDKQIALQLDLMDGSNAAPSWKCAPEALCPPNLQFNAKVFSRAAQPSGTWSARMQVCVDGDNNGVCGGTKDTPVSGLRAANPACFSGTSCTALGAAGSETSNGVYALTLSNLASPSWNSLQSSVNARDVYLAVGYHDATLPSRVTASSQKTHCPGNPPINSSETLFDCLNLGIVAKLDQATFDPTKSTLTATTATTFNTTTNLKAGTLTLYWADANQCGDTWNPVAAGAPALTLTSIASSSVTASATSVKAVNVRAQLSNTLYGTVLGACVPVSSLDTDGDGFSVAQGDCNDNNPAIKPGAPEIAGDSVDQNCDGAETCFKDADNDGYRPDLTSTVASTDTDCLDVNEAVSADATTDCNDANASIKPGVTEIAGDSVDQNCDGAETCFKDADNDGYRPNTTSAVTSTDTDCLDANEAVSTDLTTDCNDANAAIKPGTTEIAGDSVDQNCDGAEVCFKDADNDGYRPDSTSTVASTDTDCLDANEAVGTDPTSDCNDADATIKPGATEVCNSKDDDCDGTIDDGTTGSTWYRDADADTFGNSGIAVTACSKPTGYVSNSSDCNDASAAIKPGATEIAGDSVDQNCDGTEACFKDADNDGYRPDSTSTVVSTDTDCIDANEAVGTDPITDCNDADATIKPGATEVCNSKDDDCDGAIDDGATASTWYRDADNDGYGTVTNTTSACTKPTGYVSNSSDCNDGNAAIKPGAVEVCDSANVDENCNSLSDDADSTVDPATKTLWFHLQPYANQCGYLKCVDGLLLCDPTDTHFTDEEACESLNRIMACSTPSP